jgi:murein DD-endopeptidase MepM/ murein hydrolase activator NlpD
VRINLSAATFLLTLLLSVGLLVWVIQRTEHRAVADGGGVPGWQQADTPAAVPTPGDPWLDLPDAWTEAGVPLAESAHVASAVAAGEEIPAAADGVVIFAGMRDGVRVVILGHRAPDGTRFESIYAPLDSTSLAPGALVGRGMSVGRLGQGAMPPVLPNLPDGVGEAGPGFSPLAEAMMSGDPQAWMSLEIGNAEKLMELLETAED